MSWATRVGGGRAELRANFGAEDILPRPSQAGGSWSVAGRRVTPSSAFGLPAALAAIRILAQTVGSMPMLVHSGERHASSVPAPDAPQWALLNRRPNDQQTPFDFYSFLITSLQGYGGAAILKTKGRGGVEELYPMDPRRYAPRVEGGKLVFHLHGGAKLTREDVIYVPGLLLENPLIGVSPITAHANAIGTAIGVEEYAGRFFENDATPGGVLNMPFNSNSTQAKDQKELWEDGHRGGNRAHKMAVLFGGATYQTVGVNARDAQIVESQQWGVDQMARCFGLPGWILGAEKDGAGALSSEARRAELLMFAVQPWIARIEQALHKDDDLFPDKSLFPAMFSDGLLRADTATRYAAYLQGRQAGWLSVNDIRAEENKPPIEGGDEYQTTPVGGAPNLQPGEAPAPPDEAPEGRSTAMHLHIAEGAFRAENHPPEVHVNAPDITAGIGVEATDVYTISVRATFQDNS